MESGIFWLLGLVVVEAAVFAFTLFLTRIFTRSHDAEWADESLSASPDRLSDATQEAKVVADERERATS
jgi:hypothetical protein